MRLFSAKPKALSSKPILPPASITLGGGQQCRFARRKKPCLPARARLATLDQNKSPKGENDVRLYDTMACPGRSCPRHLGYDDSLRAKEIRSGRERHRDQNRQYYAV